MKWFRRKKKSDYLNFTLCEITLARLVLPQPGGPQRIRLGRLEEERRRRRS